MKRNNAKYGYLWFVVIAVLFSCEKQTQWDLQQSTPFMVVDAIITSEFKAQQVLVYRSSPNLNKPPEPISSAVISIYNGSQMVNFEPDSNNPGLYVSAPFAATVDKTYALLIEYNGARDTAIAQMEAISPFKQDTLIVKDNLYKYIYGGSSLPAMTEVFYDWSSNTGYCSTFGSCYASQTFYTISNIDVAEEFGPAKQEIWFPAGTTLIRKKYSLTKSHQEFIRSLLIETEWRGGLFDMEQGNVLTNFSHGTRGWFAACMVISDTNIVE